MNYFEKQMRILFGESELFSETMCSGKMMIGKIDQDIRVKLEFISTHIAKQYNAMKVSQRIGTSIAWCWIIRWKIIWCCSAILKMNSLQRMECSVAATSAAMPSG